LKYRISHGPRENEFAPNINVVDEAFSGTLAAYVDANLQNMERLFVNLKVLGREDFRTQDNEAAVKVVTENEQRAYAPSDLFFIGSRNRKYVVTCTALADSGDKFDTAFAGVWKHSECIEAS
jgi:hypothetical protein